MVAGMTGLIEPEKVEDSSVKVAMATDEDVRLNQPWSLVTFPVSEDEDDHGDQEGDDFGDDDDQDGSDNRDLGTSEETEEADEFDDFDDDDFDDEFDDDFEEELDEDYDANEDNFGDDFDSNGVDFPGDDSFGKRTGGSPDESGKKSTD